MCASRVASVEPQEERWLAGACGSLALAPLASGAMPPKVKVGQRQREAAVPRGEERSRLYQAIGRLQTQLAQVRAFAAPLLTPMQFAMRYNAQAAGPEGREELIIYLYQGDYSNFHNLVAKHVEACAPHWLVESFD